MWKDARSAAKTSVAAIPKKRMGYAQAMAHYSVVVVASVSDGRSKWEQEWGDCSTKVPERSPRCAKPKSRNPDEYHYGLT